MPEIYNAPELRNQLVAKGHRFRSASDNEVLLHGYETWGDEFLERIEGMFAFVMWDERRARLIAARDRSSRSRRCSRNYPPPLS